MGRGAAGGSASRSSAAVGSDSAASPCLRRWRTLLTTTLRRDLGPAERDVEIVGLAEAHLADHVSEQRRADDLLGGQALLAQCVLKLLSAPVLGVTP